MAVATLVIYATSTAAAGIPNFSFDTFPTVDGYPSFQTEIQEEELTSPGIDGKRWRTVFSQYPPVVVDESNPAWTAVSTHILAANLADLMRQAKGRFGLLTVSTGGTRTVKMNVHVSAVRARVNPGSIVGPSISGSASVFSTWVLDVLEPK